MNVYPTHDDGEANSEEFTLQLSIIDKIVERNQHFEVIFGGDFNVDFPRNWWLTYLLNVFAVESICVELLNVHLYDLYCI